MHAITEKDLMSWKPDMSARSGWPEVSGMYGKTEKGRASDLRDMSREVYVVRIVNVYGEEVYVARVAGNDQEVRNASDELLNTLCRRWPGTFLKYTYARYIQKD